MTRTRSVTVTASRVCTPIYPDEKRLRQPVVSSQARRRSSRRGLSSPGDAWRWWRRCSRMLPKRRVSRERECIASSERFELYVETDDRGEILPPARSQDGFERVSFSRSTFPFPAAERCATPPLLSPVELDSSPPVTRRRFSVAWRGAEGESSVPQASFGRGFGGGLSDSEESDFRETDDGSIQRFTEDGSQAEAAGLAMITNAGRQVLPPIRSRDFENLENLQRFSMEHERSRMGDATSGLRPHRRSVPGALPAHSPAPVPAAPRLPPRQLAKLETPARSGWGKAPGGRLSAEAGSHRRAVPAAKASADRLSVEI